MRWQERIGSRIGQRVALLFVCCAILPLAALALLTLTRVSKELTDEAYRELAQSAKATGMTLMERLLLLETDLRLAADQVRAGRNLSDAGPLAERLAGRFRSLVLYRGKETEPLLGADPPPRAGLDSSQEQHLLAGHTVLQVADGAVRLVVAVERGGAAAAIVGTPRRDQFLGGEAVIPPLGDLWIRDAAGEVLLSSTGGEIPAGLWEMSSGQVSSRRLRFASRGVDHLGARWDLFMNPRFHANWTIVHARPRADLLRALGSFQSLFLQAALLSFLIVAALSIFLIRRTLTPIGELLAATRRVADGDFTTDVDIRSRDEFALLGRSFNRMQAELIANIRRREQTEQDLVKARDAAIAATQKEIRFVSSVSHELRTPLTSIVSFAELLQDFEGLPPATRSEFLDILDAEARHLTKLIDEVLELNQLQEGSARPEDRVDVEATIRDAVAGLEEGRRARVHLDLASDLPLVKGDARLLSILWTHLLDNGLTYSPAGTPVTVRTIRQAGRILVDVADRGIGIAPDQQEAVFERFHQVGDDILTAKNKGTGLGLSLVREIARLHGGSVGVTSSVGEGSTFRVSLPEGPA